MEKKKNEIVKRTDPSISKKGILGSLDKLDGNLGALIKGLSKIELPRLFYQLVIFAIDASNSMNSQANDYRSKAQEVDLRIKEVIDRFRNSKNANCFDISFTAFSNDFNSSFGIMNLKDIGSTKSFNPFDYIDEPKGTFLAEALKDISNTAESYLQSHRESNTQVLILILSDGYLDDYIEAKDIIDKLKKNSRINIACQYIDSEVNPNSTYYSYNEETDEIDESRSWTAEEVMESRNRIIEKFKVLTTSEDLFITTPNPEEIRNHMIKSISTVSSRMV